MKAILKRELLSYFQSPLGYVFIGVMFFFTGYYFFTYNLFVNTTDMTALFGMLFNVVLFLVPVLTMRLMSEDKRSRTEQLLFTAPVSRYGIVLGKYLAALLVFVIAILSTMLVAVIMSFFARAQWPVILGNFAGLLLLGATLIAICLFLSSLTESQVIAAVCGFGVSLFLILVDALSYVVTSPFFKSFFALLSFNSRYRPFTMGILNLSGTVFFVSIAFTFLCLTVAVLDRRRWS